MSHEAIIEKLNQQLNREISTFLRYMRQGAAIRGAEYDAVRSMYLAEVADEVGHAQYLTNQICMLGGQPRLDPDLSAPPTTVPEMLRADIAAEAEDVKNYAAIARQAEEAGLYALKQTMEEQAADEDEHRLTMERLLG